MPGLLPLYLRLEPAKDAVTADLRRVYPAAKAGREVAIYRDRGCTQRMGAFPWWYESTARLKRSRPRTITVNCWRWHAIWLPALPAS